MMNGLGHDRHASRRRLDINVFHGLDPWTFGP
jgi:hypothetical protein